LICEPNSFQVALENMQMHAHGASYENESHNKVLSEENMTCKQKGPRTTI